MLLCISVPFIQKICEIQVKKKVKHIVNVIHRVTLIHAWCLHTLSSLVATKKKEKSKTSSMVRGFIGFGGLWFYLG